MAWVRFPGARFCPYCSKPLVGVQRILRNTTFLGAPALQELECNVDNDLKLFDLLLDYIEQVGITTEMNWREGFHEVLWQLGKGLWRACGALAVLALSKWPGARREATSF
jgi:hypothetical protein